jgi:phosphoglycerate kinase
MEAPLPTIRDLIDAGAKPVLMSHFGRPGGAPDADLSFEPFVTVLEDLLETRVRFAPDCIGEEAQGTVTSLESGEVGLLENVRFHPGEKANDPDFAQALAGLGEAYVNEAFGTSHRAHASIVGVPEHLDQAVAGGLMKREYSTLTQLKDHPDRPLVVLLGGAKVSDKFPLIRTLLDVADRVLIGGAMAHTFFRAMGYGVGASLVEEDSVDEASELLDNTDQFRGELIVSRDVRAEGPEGQIQVFSRDDIPNDWSAKDIGPETLDRFLTLLEDAQTVFWNGPMGVFEEDDFETGTRDIVSGLADLSTRVVVGGGDSGAAVTEYNSPENFYHVSTGGGAALELLEGKSLPGFEALDRDD